MVKNNKTFEVAVVGAGPAGSSLAYWLVKSGFEVVLIDKETFPRKKVCAGGLPVKILDILPFDVSEIIECNISEISITYKLKTEFSRTYKKTLMYTVLRERLDHFIVQRAAEVGVVFLDRHKVEGLKIADDGIEITTAANTIKAKIVVGADGANSLVAKSANLTPYDFLHLGIQTELPVELAFNKSREYQEKIAIDWGSIQDGYGWIFPKKDLLSIGVKGPVGTSKLLRDYHLCLLKHHGFGTDNINLTGHLIPHRISNKPIVKNKVLLIGDAAGLADFWTGEGIFYALKSAQIAAQQIKKYFEGDPIALGEYEIIINREIMPELRTSYYFSKVFNYIVPIAFKVIKNYDYPWDLFCRIMRGDRTFLETKNRLRPDIFLRKLLFKSQRSSFRNG